MDSKRFTDFQSSFLNALNPWESSNGSSFEAVADREITSRRPASADHRGGVGCLYLKGFTSGITRTWVVNL
jgi:hypothetical protein